MGGVTSEQALRFWAYNLVREENYALSVDEVVEDAGKIVAFILAKPVIVAEQLFPISSELAEEAREGAPFRVWSARSSTYPEDDTCVIRQFPDGRGEFSSVYGGWIPWAPTESGWTKHQEINISDLPVKLQKVK